jgi:hypothetical protein
MHLYYYEVLAGGQEADRESIALKRRIIISGSFKRYASHWNWSSKGHILSPASSIFTINRPK